MTVSIDPSTSQCTLLVKQGEDVEEEEYDIVQVEKWACLGRRTAGPQQSKQVVARDPKPAGGSGRPKRAASGSKTTSDRILGVDLSAFARCAVRLVLDDYDTAMVCDWTQRWREVACVLAQCTSE